ncbi:tRNA N(3)-methylcytidine methyltransferase METTL6 [Geodia barretti]|uniref:tRNA N(3)-methylcytidine methyltransferase METTL6 n=1 Tax=Geodia barretti TaxID=519541 RepID=A0AA35SP17_GEOBA|nr:tRNA N(3)-methylcytidine methyltransferase METTL6 [Geodia barretti]
MEEDPGRGHYAKKLTEKEIKKLEHEQQLSDYQRTKFEREAKKSWDLFYKRNTTHFFKDRHWITREFPELLQAISEVDDSHPVLLEVGCGVGNALFPLLEENDALFVHACDFSPRAIEFVKSHPGYTEARCSAFVCDITEEPLSSRLRENSVDIALMIFVLSAISPNNMIPALKNIFQVLKPGGSVLFRDYGLYDHAMLRFGRGHKISENFYVRQDGTRAYYFSEGE